MTISSGTTTIPVHHRCHRCRSRHRECRHICIDMFLCERVINRTSLVKRSSHHQNGVFIYNIDSFNEQSVELDQILFSLSLSAQCITLVRHGCSFPRLSSSNRKSYDGDSQKENEQTNIPQLSISTFRNAMHKHIHLKSEVGIMHSIALAPSLLLVRSLSSTLLSQRPSEQQWQTPNNRAPHLTVARFNLVALSAKPKSNSLYILSTFIIMAECVLCVCLWITGMTQSKIRTYILFFFARDQTNELFRTYTLTHTLSSIRCLVACEDRSLSQSVISHGALTRTHIISCCNSNSFLR